MNQLDLFAAAPVMARPARPDTPMLLAMDPDYVKPAQPPARPIWRNGEAGTYQQMKPMQQADLSWLAHNYQDHSQGGRWFYFDTSEKIWRCIDPFDAMGINDKPDSPPAINSSGRVL